MKIRKKIVTIGGGTGSFTLLSGLKNYPIDITAIVSMADDGGSAGRLRDELGVLPAGDVRQCLVALSESSHLMRELMGYRFEDGSLRGHSFGNIFVSALQKVCGGMSEGVEEAGKILNVRGRVLPVTEGDMRLVIGLENGTVLNGEDELDTNEELRQQGTRLTSIGLQQPVAANSDALLAIREADMIILGPGDQFASIIPNLLAGGMAEAIQDSQAEVLYIANLTNKRGLTPGWTVDSYVDSLEGYIGRDRIDAVIWNQKPISKRLIAKYEEQEGERAVVRFDPAEKPSRRYKLVAANIVSNTPAKKGKHDAIAETRSFIRHDLDKLAQAVMFVLEFESHQDIIHDIL